MSFTPWKTLPAPRAGSGCCLHKRRRLTPKKLVQFFVQSTKCILKRKPGDMGKIGQRFEPLHVGRDVRPTPGLQADGFVDEARGR
jgi:hypothetical protein